jgi:Tfp pilus assembly protein PilF
LHIFDLARIWAGLARLDLAWEDGPGRDLPIARAPPPPLAVDVDMGYMETDATRLFQKAVAHQNAQEYTQAIAMLRRTVQANAFHGSAHNNLAWLLLTGPEAVRDPKAGLAHAQQACRLAPAQPTFTNTLGVALVRNAKYAEAVPVLEASLAKSKVPAELEPTNLYFLAVCHLHLGDTGKARACLERADRWLEQRRGQLTDAVRSELTVFQEEARRALKAQPPTK